MPTRDCIFGEKIRLKHSFAHYPRSVWLLCVSAPIRPEAGAQGLSSQGTVGFVARDQKGRDVCCLWDGNHLLHRHLP